MTNNTRYLARWFGDVNLHVFVVSAVSRVVRPQRPHINTITRVAGSEISNHTCSVIVVERSRRSSMVMMSSSSQIKFSSIACQQDANGAAVLMQIAARRAIKMLPLNAL
jgi:hypothetical protein